MAISPGRRSRMTPPSPCVDEARANTTSRTALGKVRLPKRIRETISCAQPAARMNISPCPVATRRSDRFVRVVPRTRDVRIADGGLAFPFPPRHVPSGEVSAANRPSASSATAPPTVPTGYWSRSRQSRRSPLRIRSSCRRPTLRSGKKVAARNQREAAVSMSNSSAPAPRELSNSEWLHMRAPFSNRFPDVSPPHTDRR